MIRDQSDDSKTRPRILAGFGLGSNIQPEHHIQVAIAALRNEFPDLLVSPVYRCKAIGFDGDPFLNLVVATETSRSLQSLRVKMKRLEAASGRSGFETKYSGRTLDIDILFYGELVCRNGQIHLPRKDVVKYAYVLKPLTDILPNWVHPERHCSVSELWQTLINEAGSEQKLLERHGIELAAMQFSCQATLL